MFPSKEGSSLKIEKLKFVMNYFRTIIKEIKSGRDLSAEFVVFYRKCVSTYTLDVEYWQSLSGPLLDVEIINELSIEDHTQVSQVDFANKFLGGGVLNHGMVQEEIMLLNAPETLVGLLFVEQLADNEALEIAGARKMSSSTGYSGTCRFSGSAPQSNLDDKSDLGVHNCHIIAIDAIKYMEGNISSQFKSEQILRELNKAYIGFSSTL